MVLFSSINPVFQVITDNSQQSLLSGLRESIKQKSTYHVNLDRVLSSGDEETFHDFSMYWESTYGSWSYGGFYPDTTNIVPMKLKNFTNKKITVSLFEININVRDLFTNVDSYAQVFTRYIIGFLNESFKISIKLESETVAKFRWEYKEHSAEYNISDYMDGVFWISVNTKNAYPIIHIYNDKLGALTDDLEQYNNPDLLELKTMLDSEIIIPPQNHHKFEHILMYGERFSPLPEEIHEREGFPIDNVYIDENGNVFNKVPVSSGTSIDLHVNPPDWNPHINGIVPWVGVHGVVQPSTEFTHNSEAIGASLSSGSVLLSRFDLDKGQQWIMLNGFSNLQENNHSALWGIAMGLVAVNDARITEGAPTEPLYGNQFKMPYHSYFIFDNNGNSYDTITEALKIYNSSGTLIDTITDVNNIAHIVYTWYPDSHELDGIYMDIHMSSGVVNSYYMGPAGKEPYVIALQNMWGRDEIPSVSDAHLSLNTVFSNTVINDADQQSTNTNIHLVPYEKQYVTEEEISLILNNTVIKEIKEPYASHVNDLSTFTPIRDPIYIKEGLYKFNINESPLGLEDVEHATIIYGKDYDPPLTGSVYVHVTGNFGSIDITDDSGNTYPDRITYDSLAPEPFTHTNFLSLPSTESLVIEPNTEYIIYTGGSGFDLSQDLIDTVGSGNLQYIKDENGVVLSSGSSSGNYIVINIGSGVISGSGISIVGIKNPFTGITGIYDVEEDADHIVLSPSNPNPTPFAWDNTEPVTYVSSGSSSGLNVGSGGEVIIKNPENEFIYGWLIDASINIHGTPTITEPFAQFGDDFKLYIEPEWNLIWEYKTHTGKLDIEEIVLAGPFKVLVDIVNDYPIITVFNEDTNTVADLSSYGNNILKEIKDNSDLSDDFKIHEHTDENYDIYYQNFVVYKPPNVPTIDEINNENTGSGSGAPPEPTVPDPTYKSVVFSGNGEYLKQKYINEISMSSQGGGIATTTSLPENANETSNHGSSRPWAIAIVFKPDRHISNQYIWNNGNGTDNIYLRLDQNGALYFGWGRENELNEFRIHRNINSNFWHGVYIGHNGARLSASDASYINLNECFDIRYTRQYITNWEIGPDLCGYQGGGTATWLKTNARMDRNYSGDFTIGGRGSENSFYGKVASMVVTGLRIYGGTMPDENEIKLMLTDPKQWEQDYKINKSTRSAQSNGNTGYWPSNYHSGYGGTQIWLMGDGTLDSFENGIRNEVHPSDDGTTPLEFVNMNADDIESVDDLNFPTE